MLKLTKKSDYGLIALRHLAAGSAASAPGHDDGATAKEIAASYRIPVPLLAKVMQALCRGGFLASMQGTNGGYRLARDPRTITALEVIRIIDGPVLLADCFHGTRECEQMSLCTVKEPLRRVHEGILRMLAGITIWDLLKSEHDQVAGGPGAMVRIETLTM